MPPDVGAMVLLVVDMLSAKAPPAKSAVLSAKAAKICLFM
jgi:hypothetical protein